jgi:5-methylcytosine-specific restriction endonuclease McrA
MEGQAAQRPAFAGKAHDPELSSSRWQAVRAAQLGAFPICEVCGKRAAEEVHHILPRAHGGDTFDPGNLASVCAECHGKLPAMYKRGVLTPDALAGLLAARRFANG